MLRSLRLKLALLYFGSALGIVVLLAAGTYIMLNRFFIQQVDLALQYKMAAQFKVYNLTLPDELKNAEKLWLDENQHSSPVMSQIQPQPVHGTTPELLSPAMKQPPESINSEDGESDSDESEGEIITSGEPHQESEETEGVIHLEEDSFDGRLSSIFIVPVSTLQGMIVGTQQATSPIDEDIDASTQALALGYDLRTLRLSDGTHVRLLTYRTNGSGTTRVIQIGRLLDDQDRLLQLYLIGLLLLGFIASLMVSILSWYLSGRSIKPAQKAWDQQQAFIANASHELRAPLTVIRADAEYGLRSGHSSDQKLALKEVVGEVDYMDRMVEDLLLLTRLDAGRLKLGIEVLDVADLFGDVIGEIKKLTNARKVTVVIGQVGGKVLADRSRLRQVLLILLDNALRFSGKNDRVEMNAVVTDRVVEISIKDQGPGISPEHIPHIFERFYQAPTDNLETTHGNGLGLSIAKGLVELQGGDIRVESKVGTGTRVIVRLPSATP